MEEEVVRWLPEPPAHRHTHLLPDLFTVVLQALQFGFHILQFCILRGNLFLQPLGEVVNVLYIR